MLKYTPLEIKKIADENNFIANTLEKVLRLFSILKYFNSSQLQEKLALKGGTAINLFLLDLPRLSVDIDFDFCLPVSKDEMKEKRLKIDKMIRKYMSSEGYILSDKSKFVHALDSYVYSYQAASGVKDNIKIEINYLNRVHVLKTVSTASTRKLGEEVIINRLSDSELIGSKVNALLARTTARDIYDVYELFSKGEERDLGLIRKIAVFDVCLSADYPVDFSSIVSSAIEKTEHFNFNDARKFLIPVLHKGIKFNPDSVKAFVLSFIRNTFVLDESERLFIDEYNKGRFKPDLLFDGYDTNDVSSHPMADWKINHIKQSSNT